MALFRSGDGIGWAPASSPLALPREIRWEDGEVQKVDNLERPQLWLDDGKPAVLFCACRPQRDGDTFNVHIPLTP